MNKKDFKIYAITSLITALFAIPFHEFGHSLFALLHGEAVKMSYARSIVLSGNENFLTVIGGPLLPLIIVYTIIVVNHLHKKNIALSAIAMVLCFDRMILYFTNIKGIFAGTLSGFDEVILANFLGLPSYAFIIVFFVLEVLAIVLLIRQLKLKKLQIPLALAISSISFAVMGAFGVFVIERYLFPDQFFGQF